MDTRYLINKHLDKFEAINKMYPNRQKEIHKVSCKNCPSVIDKFNKILDPEVEDTKLLSKPEQIKTVFT